MTSSQASHRTPKVLPELKTMSMAASWALWHFTSHSVTQHFNGRHELKQKTGQSRQEKLGCVSSTPGIGGRLELITFQGATAAIRTRSSAQEATLASLVRRLKMIGIADIRHEIERQPLTKGQSSRLRHDCFAPFTLKLCAAI